MLLIETVYCSWLCGIWLYAKNNKWTHVAELLLNGGYPPNIMMALLWRGDFVLIKDHSNCSWPELALLKNPNTMISSQLTHSSIVVRCSKNSTVYIYVRTLLFHDSRYIFQFIKTAIFKYLSGTTAGIIDFLIPLLSFYKKLALLIKRRAAGNEIKICNKKSPSKWNFNLDRPTNILPSMLMWLVSIKPTIAYYISPCVGL